MIFFFVILITMVLISIGDLVMIMILVVSATMLFFMMIVLMTIVMTFFIVLAIMMFAIMIMLSCTLMSVTECMLLTTSVSCGWRFLAISILIDFLLAFLQLVQHPTDSVGIMALLKEYDE